MWQCPDLALCHCALPVGSPPHCILSSETFCPAGWLPCLMEHGLRSQRENNLILLNQDCGKRVVEMAPINFERHIWRIYGQPELFLYPDLTCHSVQLCSTKPLKYRTTFSWKKSVLWIVNVGTILVIIVTVALLLTVIDIRSDENSPWRTCSSSPSSRRKGSPSRANEAAAVPCSPCSYGDYKSHF